MPTRRSSGLLLLLCATAWAQSALMPGKEAMAVAGRIVQLMESIGFSIPELGRASAPLQEQARRAQAALALASGQVHAGHTNTFLRAARAYAHLLDAFPRPTAYPEEARRQQGELWEAVTRMEAHFQALLEQRELSLRPADRDNLRRYADANLKLPPAAAGRPRVVFYGDSITDFWRLNEYFPGQDYVNRGISGQVTGEMLGRFKQDVLDLKPAAVVMLAGTNDIARGTALTTIQSNLTMIADLCALHKIKLILSTILPVSDYHKDQNPAYEVTKRRPPDQIRSMNQWIRSFCQNRGLTLLNYHDPLADGAGMLKKEAADDGLHPNAMGYRLMAPLAADAIQRAVGIAPPASRKR